MNPTLSLSPQPKGEEECKITLHEPYGKDGNRRQRLDIPTSLGTICFVEGHDANLRQKTNPRDNSQTTSQPAARHRAGGCMVTNPSAHRTVTRVAPHQHPCLRTAPQPSLASQLLHTAGTPRCPSLDPSPASCSMQEKNTNSRGDRSRGDQSGGCCNNSTTRIECAE